MSTVSTHVLDTGLGLPAQGVPVRLSRVAPDQAEVLASGSTDEDGRIGKLTPTELEPGTYQLWFDVAVYAASSGQDIFFPEVTVTFTITDERHYHVPLLLSPFAFSTYRGS
jgi:5-hydroxyisourate hydrolase